MVSKNRVMIASDPIFRDSLKKLKIKILVSGSDVSLPNITTIMARPEIFNEIEKRVLDEINKNTSGIGIIKLDRRKLL